MIEILTTLLTDPVAWVLVLGLFGIALILKPLLKWKIVKIRLKEIETEVEELRDHFQSTNND